MLELLVPDEPPAEELDAKPEYCGFQRFTANWCAADTDRTLGEKNMKLNKKGCKTNASATWEGEVGGRCWL